MSGTKGSGWLIGVSKNQLKKDVFEILQNGDLTVLTRKSIQNQLEAKYKIRHDSIRILTYSLADRKGEIKLAINDFLLLSNVISSSQKAKEEVLKWMLIISRTRQNRIHRVMKTWIEVVQIIVFLWEMLLTSRLQDRRESFSWWRGETGGRPPFCWVFFY